MKLVLVKFKVLSFLITEYWKMLMCLISLWKVYACTYMNERSNAYSFVSWKRLHISIFLHWAIRIVIESELLYEGQYIAKRIKKVPSSVIKIYCIYNFYINKYFAISKTPRRQITCLISHNYFRRISRLCSWNKALTGPIVSNMDIAIEQETIRNAGRFLLRTIF